ncbi:helix-turn-helix domain-containing protein [Pseudomonas aeruginosa]
MSIADSIKKARKIKGLTWAQASGALLGISLVSYKRYEGGKNAPRADQLVKLAQGLQISSDEIVMESEDRSVSEEFRSIFKRIESLPEEDRARIKMALKGLLLAIDHERLGN